MALDAKAPEALEVFSERRDDVELIPDENVEPAKADLCRAPWVKAAMSSAASSRLRASDKHDGWPMIL